MNTAFIKRIRNIPTLPSILTQIIQTLDDPDSSAADLEGIVRNDQSLTTKLLAVANSAYYGFRHQITTVRRAVVAIGFNEVRNICLGLSLMGFLHPSTFRDQEAAEQLWLHSLGVSRACQLLAEATKVSEVGQAFTAGLLHDIGKVILAAFMPDQVEEMKRLMQEDGLTYAQAEADLDISHEAVGKALAQHWDLPPVIVEVLGRHHNPTPTLAYYPVVCMVNIADAIVRRLGIGFSGDPSQPELDLQVINGLGAGNKLLQEVGIRLHNSRGEVEGYWRQLTADPNKQART